MEDTRPDVQDLPADDVAEVLKTGYLIYGSTGCTCCREHNFAEGFFPTTEAAFEAVAGHRQRRTVASQYSATGNYSVREVVYTKYGDGTCRLGDREFEGEYFLLHQWELDELEWAGTIVKEPTNG